MKCSACATDLEKEEAHYGEPATFYDNAPLCETCYYEDEPCAVVYYGRDDEPYEITSTRNATDGKFRVQWHPTDPWRGYYVIESDEYALVNTAALLSGHESEEMLSRFDKRIRELFDEGDIDYARVFSRSSNVFYSNYDLFVKKGQQLAAQILVARAKAEVEYDDPRWYRNIVFEEEILSKLSRLFPEENLQTDYDAIRLVARLGQGIVSELQRRAAKEAD